MTVQELIKALGSYNKDTTVCLWDYEEGAQAPISNVTLTNDRVELS